MSEAVLGRCWQCGTDLKAEDFGRETNCLVCGKPTRVCRNCCWYAPGRGDDCAEPAADRVMEKERANYCEFFQPTLEPRSSQPSANVQELLKAAEDLFKF
jgi:hypothetical protein